MTSSTAGTMDDRGGRSSLMIFLYWTTRRWGSGAEFRQLNRNNLTCKQQHFSRYR